MGLAPIAGSDFHAADRPGRWVGAITTPEVTELGSASRGADANHRYVELGEPRSDVCW